MNIFPKENFVCTCLYLTLMLAHAAEGKRGVNIPAELSLLLSDYPFPFMLDAHVNVFSSVVILLAF